MLKRKITYYSAALLSCAMITLMLSCAEVSSAAARDGLYYSARSVVPAIFPFSVLAAVLAEVGLPPFFIRFFPLHRLLDLPDCAASAVLCGLLCGFPVGAMSACSLYDSGRITRGEAALLCAVSSNVSPAFLVCVAGGMFSSRAFGWILWAVQSLTALLMGIFMRRLLCDATRKLPSGDRARGFAVIVCGSVARSAAACVTVTGYVVFFRVAAAVASALIPSVGGGLKLLLEFSSGVEYAASMGNRAACGLAVGFGGISAIAQVWNYASGSDVPVYPTVAVKAVSAVILALVGLVWRR